jgi:2-C-methyl-D-erythritol 4-phosphate cytidylyltransferase
MGFHALVRAAGNRFRFGADVPKQYLLLNGKPVMQHALERLQAHFGCTASPRAASRGAHAT